MTDTIRVRHATYGPGDFVGFLPEPGVAQVALDIDGGFVCRVLTRDLAPLTLAERAAELDRKMAEMMGRDHQATIAAMRSGGL